MENTGILLKVVDTYIGLNTFFSGAEDFDGEDFFQRTFGVDVSLAYDNSDLLANPSNGSYQEITFSRD